MKISAEVVADSLNSFGDRITSMVITFPRFILAELNTHRVFSRNSASSRAIPFKKMVQMVNDDPFIPYAWQKDHKGMQGVEYIEERNIPSAEKLWLESRDSAIKQAMKFSGNQVTKQLCNRLLEPFMWHRVLVTSTHWGNFFDLRCPRYFFEPDGSYFYSRKDWLEHQKDTIGLEADEMTLLDWLKINKGQAEIHMMFLAEAMWDALKESRPKILEPGQWHIPFGNKINVDKLLGQEDKEVKEYPLFDAANELTSKIIKVATGMAARTSYTTVGDEKEVSYETLINIHDKMVDAKPAHASPMEHIAKAMSEKDLDNFYKVEKGVVETGWCRNFKGFIQYRHILGM